MSIDTPILDVILYKKTQIRTTLQSEIVVLINSRANEVTMTNLTEPLVSQVHHHALVNQKDYLSLELTCHFYCKYQHREQK